MPDSTVLFYQACQPWAGILLPQQRRQVWQSVLGAAAAALDSFTSVQPAPTILALHQAHAGSFDRQCCIDHSISLQA